MQAQLNDIPMEQWHEVFDQFSRRHQGQLAELTIAAPDFGRHEQAHAMPLLGISAEPHGTGWHITVIAANPDGTHMSHEIANPTRVRFAEWNGVSGQLEIDAADGFSTSVQVGPVEQTIPEGAILDGNFERP